MWFGRQGRSNVRMRVDVGISLPSTFLCTRWIWTTPSGSKKDLISVSLSETKSSWVTTPLHKFNVGWGSTLTWRPAKDLTEEIASICRSVLASRRTLPSRCRVTFFKLPQTPSILRANFRPLTLFIVLPSSIHESSRKRCFVGWVAAKKLGKVIPFSSTRRLFPVMEEGMVFDFAGLSFWGWAPASGRAPLPDASEAWAGPLKTF